MTQLKRYTELPYVLQVLQTRRLTLLNPSSWDDKNDSHFVQTYRDKKGHGSVLALCLTEATQTYHHWRIFTHGASGACILFDKRKLLSWINEDDLIDGREVKYLTLPQIRKAPPKVDDLHFLSARRTSPKRSFGYSTARRKNQFR